jgi:hypothetical protein
MIERARRVGAGLLWLVLVVAIALGAAGLVSATDHLPGTSARAELTYDRDREVADSLDAASGRLVELADTVAALGVQARGALAALNGSDIATVEAAIAEGDRLLDDIATRTTSLRLELAAVPYIARSDTALLVSEEPVARHATMTAALDTTQGLREAWVRLTSGSVAAIQLSTLLALHDQQVVDAAALGRAARYSDAIAGLDEGDATIASARALRDQLANTVDVGVLDEWLDRNAAYDVALRNLYAEYATVGNTVTQALRDAIAAEAAARAELPPDTRGLVVIMAEIGRGGMNGAVIAIEEARGRLTAAITAAAPEATEPSAEPSPTDGS